MVWTCESESWFKGHLFWQYPPFGCQKMVLPFLPKPIRCWRRAGTRNGRISTRPWRRMTLKRWGLPGKGLPKRFGKILCNWGARHYGHYGNFLGPFHAVYLSCGFIIRTFQHSKIWTIHRFPYLKVHWDQRKSWFQDLPMINCDFPIWNTSHL